MDSSKLWYNQPAEEWTEALPIGNGRLGGMVYGGVKQERIALNEDTLWSGMPVELPDTESKEYLELVRELIFQEQYSQAQAIIENHMLGPWSSSYQAMGDLYLEFLHGNEVKDYHRELDMDQAIASTSYSAAGVDYQREVFVSAADQVMLVRIEANKQASIDLQVSLSSPLQHQVYIRNKQQLVLQGKAPYLVEPMHDPAEEPIAYAEDKGMSFQMELLVQTDGGRVEGHGGRIQVKSADTVTLIFTAATSFNGFNKDPAIQGKDPDKLNQTVLQAVSAKPYKELKRRHREDHQSLYRRVQLMIQPQQEGANLPVNERIESVNKGKQDDFLAVLFFNFGRYLLIASSRQGTQPANLQGIWNHKTRPPWTSNHTTNINTQMNYWLAETCHLPELHEPLFDMIHELQQTGHEMVRQYYGCEGWTAHHGVDIWRAAAPQGERSKGPASWAYWPMTGAWLSQHLWEHYVFSGDKDFLQKVYPILKQAALFCLDYVVEDQQGHLVSVPSTSPENTFIAPSGEQAAVSISSTMDIALMRDLFMYCIEASNLLEADEVFCQQLVAAREKLLPFQIGRKGQLQEWYKDFAEAEPGHRHTAHLYALHPSNQITLTHTPDLAQAAKKTLELRRQYEGEDTIGWCFAWNICFYARLKEPELAYHYVTKLIGNPFPNLFNAHRHPKLKEYPLTVEANFGATAGIAEMLLQSHEGFIYLLPALPKAWKNGEISGLRARGGYVVEMKWRDNRLESASITAQHKGVCKVKSDACLHIETVDYSVKEGMIEFPTEAGEIYNMKRKSIDSEMENHGDK